MPFPRPRPGQIITGAQINNASLRRTTLGSTTVADPTLTGTTTVEDLAHDGDLGFFGISPTTQPTALTAQHATLTQAGTDNADVAIQAATNGGWGFANADEFEAVVACVLNLMVRVQELEDKLQALGLLA